jgi:pimeloyl-ACP methyl ester carboxylesterase
VTTVHANGIAIHVEVMEPAGADSDTRPAAPLTFVMIHGLGTDSLASWYFTVAKPFSDAGFRVVMYDLRGHGHSDRPPTGYRVEEFVDDLSGLLAELGVEGPVYLLGNSFGGTIAFDYAHRHPDRVAGIAVIESEPATAEWSKKMAHNLGRAAKQLHRQEALDWISVNRGRRTARLARAAGRMLQATTIARDIPASRLQAAEETAAIECPVLLLYGENSDLAVQAPVMEGLLRRGRTVIVPGQHHSILVEEPHTVRQSVFSWMADHGAAMPVGAQSA